MSSDDEPEPDDFKSIGRLPPPPGLPRIKSKDDLSIVPNKKPKKTKYTHAMTPNPTSSAKKRKKKKFVDTDPKILELEAKIKSLTRDNRVLQRKLEKAESSTGKKQKKMDNEREMRLAANKERFSLKQKLEKLQKAISVRLKLLGVDFSKIDDITTALDTCFNVIRKLAKELQQKEEELQDTKTKLAQTTAELSASSKQKKEINALSELNKHLMEHEAQLNDQMKELQQNIGALNEEKTLLKSEIDEKRAEIEGLQQENERLVEQNDVLTQSKTDIEVELNKSMETVKKIQSELESMKIKHDELKNNLLTEHEAKWKNKCKEYDALEEKYKALKTHNKNEESKVKLKQNEYEKSIKTLQNKLKSMETIKKEEKQKEVTFKQTITTLHQEIAEKDKLVKSQKKQIKAMQKELDMAGFGDNKKFSQMSLLKKNVENMQNIIRDKENQIKTLRNKLNQQKK